MLSDHPFSTRLPLVCDYDDKQVLLVLLNAVICSLHCGCVERVSTLLFVNVCILRVIPKCIA